MSASTYVYVKLIIGMKAFKRLTYLRIDPIVVDYLKLMIYHMYVSLLHSVVLYSMCHYMC